MLDESWEVAITVHRVLVVDDERDLRELLSLVFARDGHLVQKADSGMSAIELLKTQKFDLVISDFWMPNGNGDKVLEFILQNEIECNLIFFSSESGLLLPTEGETFKGFVLKPNFQELKLKVNHVLKAREEKSCERNNP